MATVSIEYGRVAGTRAALGSAGQHTVIADRPPGVAGGMGLGFNGGELLALALGGCFCNDVEYTAHEMGEDVVALAVHVDLELNGEPLVATGAVLRVSCSLASGTSPAVLLDRARERCTVARSLRAGFSVSMV